MLKNTIDADVVLELAPHSMQHEDIDHRSSNSSDEGAKEGDTRKEYKQGRKSIPPDDDNNDDVISAEDLLCFAWQTARGMVRSTN